MRVNKRKMCAHVYVCGVCVCVCVVDVLLSSEVEPTLTVMEGFEGGGERGMVGLGSGEEDNLVQWEVDDLRKKRRKTSEQRRGVVTGARGRKMPLL